MPRQTKNPVVLLSLSPAMLAAAFDLFASDKYIHAAIAKIVAEQGLTQISDEAAIVSAIDQVIAANAAKVAEYRTGKEKLFGFFVGQVMKATQGKAHPQKLNELLKAKLSE